MVTSCGLHHAKLEAISVCYLLALTLASSTTLREQTFDTDTSWCKELNCASPLTSYGMREFHSFFPPGLEPSAARSNKLGQWAVLFCRRGLFRFYTAEHSFSITVFLWGSRIRFPEQHVLYFILALLLHFRRQMWWSKESLRDAAYTRYPFPTTAFYSLSHPSKNERRPDVHSVCCRSRPGPFAQRVYVFCFCNDLCGREDWTGKVLSSGRLQVRVLLVHQFK